MTVRFYAYLNDFLKKHERQFRLNLPFHGKQSIKDVIESKGVPHTEVALIVVNGQTEAFNYYVKENDHISVFPQFLNVAPELGFVKATQDIKFIADVHLGKLVRYIRLLGFDCTYYPTFNDKEIISSSLHENRIILTRDKGILMNKVVRQGCFVYSQNPKEQVIQVANRYNLVDRFDIFTRCMDCNGIIYSTLKKKVIHQILPKSILYYDDFFQCDQCKKVYWKGSHYHNMEQFIYQLKRRSALR